jgi:trehalose 6-phosphate phosphatase
LAPDPTTAVTALGPVAADPAGTLVATDFDGTLSAIVADPEAARPLPAAVDALGSLQARVGAVAVVSGRPVAFLEAVLPVDGLVLVGQYGLERSTAAGTVLADPAVDTHLAAVADAAADAERTFPDLYVERKGRLAVTVHWRRTPGRGRDVSRWAEATATRLGLARYPTKMAVELRPPVDVDKGTALEALAEGRRVVVFAGDDRGDLAAFDALDRLAARGVHTVRVGVRSSEAPPELVARADVTVEGAAGVADLFAALAARLDPKPDRRR